jgi:hypothetical protein
MILSYHNSISLTTTPASLSPSPYLSSSSSPPFLFLFLLFSPSLFFLFPSSHYLSHLPTLRLLVALNGFEEIVSFLIYYGAEVNAFTKV